jgi:putative spermidine/putrescine transport system permease protein
MNHQSPPFLTPFVIVTYLLLLAPLVIVIAVSFGPSPNYQFPPTGFSLKWYRAFFSNPQFVGAFFRVSLVLGVLAALGSTLLGGLAAISLVRARFAGREVVEAFFLAPLFIPEILFAAALYLVYARIGIRPSMWALLAGHLVVCTPYVIRNVIAGLSGLDPRLEEAAMSLGANRAQAFVKVALPLIRSSVLSGCVLAFVISFSDIYLALFISAPNSTTLPVYIFNLLIFGSDPSAAAASTLSIVMIGVLIWTLQIALRRPTREPRRLAAKGEGQKAVAIV